MIILCRLLYVLLEDSSSHYPTLFHDIIELVLCLNGEGNYILYI